jgi:NAD(P)H dehydrogenase (quinone)
MTSAQNAHGGQETTLQSLYTTAMHWGSIIVVPGYTDPVLFEAGGNPYGVSAQAGDVTEKVEAAIRHQARRQVEITARIA